MTYEQAKNLKPGHRLVIWKGYANEAHGVVAIVGDNDAVFIEWDDGQRSTIHMRDFQAVEREEQAAA